LCFLCFLFFFFSSRRRHTRCLSDWSSDVCSSDLFESWGSRHGFSEVGEQSVGRAGPDPRLLESVLGVAVRGDSVLPRARQLHAEIGRASCRERVWISVVAVAVKKKKEKDKHRCCN